MTINEAMTTAVKEGYHVKSFAGIEMYLSGANDEWSVWTRKDTESSFMARVEETFLDASFSHGSLIFIGVLRIYNILYFLLLEHLSIFL